VRKGDHLHSAECREDPGALTSRNLIKPLRLVTGNLYLYPFFFLLDGGGWLTPRPGRFTPGTETRCPLYRRLRGLQGRSGRVVNISSTPELNPRNIQNTASRCTDWAIAAHITVFEQTWVKSCTSTGSTWGERSWAEGQQTFTKSKLLLNTQQMQIYFVGVIPKYFKLRHILRIHWLLLSFLSVVSLCDIQIKRAIAGIGAVHHTYISQWSHRDCATRFGLN
jgi:hypothetical protein